LSLFVIVRSNCAVVFDSSGPRSEANYRRVRSYAKKVSSGCFFTLVIAAGKRVCACEGEGQLGTKFRIAHHTGAIKRVPYVYQSTIPKLIYERPGIPFTDARARLSCDGVTRVA